MKFKIAAALGLFLTGAASAATIESLSPVSSVDGTEIIPVSHPLGGSVYETRSATISQVNSFFLAAANTWLAANTFSNTLDATSPTSGTLIVSGGVGVAKSVWANGIVHANSTTDSSSTSTGSIISLGGAGIAKNLYVGGTANISGVATFTSAPYFAAPPINNALNGYIKGNGASAETASLTIPATDLSGTLIAARFPAFSGDVTTSAGALVNTLATVNSNVGTYGSASSIPSLTVTAKGLVTAASATPVIAPAGTLSGPTLAPGVTASSLTSFGNIFALNVNNLLVSSYAPTIISGCGGTATISANNGPAAFRVTIGSTPSASCVIGLPTAANGWNCYVSDTTTSSTSVFLQKMTTSTASSATLTNYNSAATATTYPVNDVLSVSCFAY